MYVAEIAGLTKPPEAGASISFGKRIGEGTNEAISRFTAVGVANDLQAIRERHEREVNPRVSTAGWQVYDRYLKANRVDAGTASYADVVKLVLGTGIR